MKIIKIDYGYNLCVQYSMEFEWDEKKRLLNLEKHGLDFKDVMKIFDAPHIVVISQHSHEEERFLAIGLFDDIFFTVVYTLRHHKIRIISFRRARHEERKKYQELFGSRA
jgi:uncharacterized protein